MTIVDAVSPNGGNIRQRQRLSERFSDRLSVNPVYSRKTVSYQGNRNVPGFRWMKYKEGFSRELVSRLIDEYRPEAVLDPFSGMGTTPLVAVGKGKEATGIEIMPIGVLAAEGITQAANGVSVSEFDQVRGKIIKYIRSHQIAPCEFSFPHVRITEKAFSRFSELEIAKARQFISLVDSLPIRTLLNLACISALEQSSYTRKDGQYLRWDRRSGRPKAKLEMGCIPPFNHVLESKLAEMSQDISVLKDWYHGGHPNLMTGSSLELLRTVPQGAFDMVVTSPPYANRYDYTRTYALELAWLGYNQEKFSNLRQRMLSATVENKTKIEWLNQVYSNDNEIISHAQNIYSESAVHEVLSILRERIDELSNRHIIRLIEGYFFEMAVIIAELGRIMRPNGIVIMVNDNVQYHGEEIPVDFVLSDYAERSGFVCTDIWMLPKGKGNSSQQMAKFGRREIRKCVYKWVRTCD